MSGMSSCSDVSRTLGEPIGGTAVVETTHWLMIQVNEGWARKTPDAAPLEGRVRAHLDSALAAFSGARLQLLRRPCESTGVVVMVAHCGADSGALYRLQLPDIESLLSLDLVAFMANGSGGELIEESVFLVCTHGIRDRCCAKLGVPVYQRLAQERGEQVWQTTHLGGHRFAATMVVLPQGLQFGRVTAAEIPDMLAALDQDRIYSLERFRGRVAKSRLAQVAEAHVREAQSLVGLCDVVCESSGSDLVCMVKGAPVRIQLTAKPHAQPRANSCGDQLLKSPQVYSVSASE